MKSGRTSGWLSCCEQPVPDVGAALVGDDDPDDHRDGHPEAEDRLARHVRHPVERAPEDVAQRAEDRRPEAGPDDAVGDEAPVGEARRPGDEGRQGPDEADEAADQDRLAAVPVEVSIHLVEPLVRDLDARAVLLEEVAPEPAADEEARGVAEDRADPDDRDQRQERDGALACDHPARDHHRLARRNEPDESARLEEGHHADERVGPRTERLGDVLDHILRIGQLGQDPGRIDGERERDQDPDPLALERQPPPPPDDIGRDQHCRDGGDDLAGVHAA